MNNWAGKDEKIFASFSEHFKSFLSEQFNVIEKINVYNGDTKLIFYLSQ